MASAPHVRVPAWLHATIGKVPWALRRADAGAVEPVHTSSMPPVPNVILARPGRTQPLAHQAGLLIADQCRERRRAG